MPCDACRPYNGLFRRAANGGMERCACADGARLAQIEDDRKNDVKRAPVLSTEDVTIYVEMLAGSCEFFPSESGARTAVGAVIRGMCGSATEALWLVERMGRLFKRWPGTRDMRLVYCSKYRPLDGFELVGGTTAYPDGIPSESEAAERAALGPAEGKYLPAPLEPASRAESLRNTVTDLAAAKRIGSKPGSRVRDIPIFPVGAKTVTQADIEAAVSANREKVAKNELGL